MKERQKDEKEKKDNFFAFADYSLKPIMSNKWESIGLVWLQAIRSKN